MPTRKPRSARSLPTCCDTSASCDVAHIDATCAPPVPDACPDCGMTANDHEGRRLGYPWCMVRAVFASRFERLTSRGTWAYRYDRIVRDGEVKFESRFWRDACHVSTGRAYGLPRAREFIGRAACSPAHEQVTIDPVDGMRLMLVEPPAAAKVLPRLSFAALRAAHRRAFSGRRRMYGRGRHVATLGEYDARAWREALAAQARPLSTKQLAALLNIYAGAGVDVTPYEHLGWRADRRVYEAAVMAAYAQPPMPCAVKAGTYTLMCENTTKGPVINGVPDANVAYSAYVLDGEIRVDLFGCGSTPEAAVDSLAQDALAQLGHVRRARQLDNLDEPMTPEMRERADAVVAEMRARWAAKDVAPLPIWWFLNCGPGGLLPLNRDPGEYSACDGTEWYFGERCPTPRSRSEIT